MAERLPYHVGDIENGTLVQSNGAFGVTEASPQWLAFTSITVSTAAVNLGASRLSHNRAYITVESNSIRYTVDASVPTASLGHLVLAGSFIELHSAQELAEFQAIAQGASATLMVSFGNI